MQVIANNIIISLITFYQRYISPRKGFCCAHRAYHGGVSCSVWAQRILNKYGVFLFIPLMRRRFKACITAHEKLKEQNEEKNKKPEEINTCPCTKNEIATCCVSGWPFS